MLVSTLHCVTITGADDSIAPDDLIDLTARYPFVEWGILFSQDRFGTPRYPSMKWVDWLTDIAAEQSIPLSAHLCGRFARAALAADWAWQRALGGKDWFFGRVQINCGHNPEPAIGPMLREWPTTQRVIVQCSDKNQHWIEGAVEDGARFDVLYDTSGGRGILPPRWPMAIDGALCGYAGGLGPENIADNMPCFIEAAGGRSFWIDMESKVRSDDGAFFDLSKAERALKAARPFFVNAGVSNVR